MIEHVRRLVVLLMLGVVSSCASVPITSMIQLAAMGSGGLEQVDPTEIRVRVSVFPGFGIDLARTTLGFSIARFDGPIRNEKLTLELIERTTMGRSLGFMRGSSSVLTYVLRLTPADVQKFLDNRKPALGTDSRAKRILSVSAPFSKIPKIRKQ